MALSKCSLVLALAILSICVVDAAHHQSAAAPSPSSSSVDCSSLILNMADCLSFVSSGSEVSKPESTCCSGLKTVIKADPECLCEGFKSSASLGVNINITKAMTLPALCKVSAPVSNCDLSLSPAGAPDTQPPAIAGAPSEGASETAPAQAPGSSGSAVLSVSIGSIVVSLMIMLVSMA